MAIAMRRIGANIAVVLAILTSPTAAQHAGQTGKAAAAPAQISQGPLDGMTFVGTIGPEGEQNLEDELHFDAGQFWSSNCVACGYQPGAYWTRTVGDSIHFRGSLQSAGGGSFEYSGRVARGRVDVQINWIQKRWYGDAKRKLVFAGARAPAPLLRNAPALQIAAGQSDRCRRL